MIFQTMKRRIKILFFLSVLALRSFAQMNDAQFWENINIEKNINPRFIVRLNQEGRLTENFTSPSFNYFDIGCMYKAGKHVHLTLAYVWEEKHLYTGIWSMRHQAYTALTLRKSVGDFSFNYRVMTLLQVKDVNTSADGRFPDYYLRNKITVKYDRSFRYCPYIASELYYKINSTEVQAYHFDRVRYFAGMFYRPNKINEFELYYLIEQHMNERNAQRNWVVGLGYTHSF